MIRATPEEHDGIIELAETCNLTVPEFMRRMALGFQPKSGEHSENFRQLAKTNGDLGRLGGLLKLYLSDKDRKEKSKPLNINEIINNIRFTQIELKKIARELSSNDNNDS